MMNRLYEKTISKLPLFILCLFMVQPFMDITSFWLQKFEFSNVPTLLLRFAVLAVTALLGFVYSKRKPLYLVFACVCALIWTGHIIACLQVGYQDPVSDFTNYIRVLQMPLFAVCMISFVKANRDCARAIENGFIVNFWIITASVCLALITGTYATTYGSVGLLGWFATTNAQSAVISLLSPVVIICAYRRKNIILYLATVLTSFLQLFFFGTRLAFSA